MRAAITIGLAGKGEPASFFEMPARRAGARLRKRGFEVHEVLFSDEDVDLSALRRVPTGVSVYVHFGHGGYDGPFWTHGIQASPFERAPAVATWTCSAAARALCERRGQARNPVLLWSSLVEEVRRVVAPGGLVVVLSCNAGGGGGQFRADHRWASELAKAAGRHVLASQGSTLERTVGPDMIAFALDGRPKIPGMVAFEPGGTQVFSWSGWSSNAARLTG